MLLPPKEISEFFGISIYMYYEDHNPLHFHAVYNEHKALIDIQNGCVFKGSLPTKQIKLVLAWCEIHKDELLQNWELATKKMDLRNIAPLV